MRCSCSPAITGGWHTDTVTGMAKLAQEIDRQAAMLGYMNAFILYTAMSVIAIPLVLLLGGRRRGSV